MYTCRYTYMYTNMYMYRYTYTYTNMYLGNSRAPLWTQVRKVAKNPVSSYDKI